MQRRRELMGMQTDGLPGAYRRVEYLESSGTQQIITQVSGSCEFDITAQSLVASSVRILLGHGINGGMYFGVTNVEGSSLRWSLGGSVNSDVDATEWADVHVQFTITASESIVTATIGDETISRTSSYNTASLYHLFGYDNAYNTHARISRCVCRQNGVIVCDFIPCVRKSDNKPGMYDTISKTFYTNEGLGEFIVPAA